MSWVGLAPLAETAEHSLGACQAWLSAGKTWQQDQWGTTSRAGPQKSQNVNEVGSALALHFLFFFRPCSIHVLFFSSPLLVPGAVVLPDARGRDAHGPGVLQTEAKGACRRAAASLGSPGLAGWEKGKCCWSGPLTCTG